MSFQRIEGVAIAGRKGRHDIALAEGRITALTPSQRQDGGFVMPLMNDCHVHLDKTFTAHRLTGTVQSLFDAIEMMNRDKEKWSEADLFARAGRALERAFLHGVGAMRSHVDWRGPEAPLAWNVIGALKEEWRGRVDIQRVALCPLDLVDAEGDAIAAQVRRDGGVLGAFVYRNDGLEEKVERVFALAAAHDLALDFHVDEGLEAQADGLSAIIEATARHDMGGWVLCGHACSLALREEAALGRILDRGAAAGIGLVVLPTTNLHLQDRRTGRAPRLRGIAPVHEAQAAGLEVMIASDNCRDAFYPHGDYDPMDVFRTAVLACHLEPAEWLPAIGARAARWCGAAAGEIAPGAPADFILFDAEDLDDLVARPGARRTVLRTGEAVGSRPAAEDTLHG